MEIDFRLPVGYVDAGGEVHTRGRLRLATIADEIEAMSSSLVQRSEAYLPVAILGRVVTALGTLAHVDDEVVAGLHTRDFAFLEQLYLRLNGVGEEESLSEGVSCPRCSAALVESVEPSQAVP